MVDDEQRRPFTYDAIVSEAQSFGTQFLKKLPQLPEDEVLLPIRNRIERTDLPLIQKVQEHLGQVGTAHGHKFEEHVMWVAVRGAYVAEQECDVRSISGDEKNQIVQRAWRLGLLHDVDRNLGHTEIHMIEGSKTTERILGELNIQDSYLPEQVLHHDDMDVNPTGNNQRDVSFYSVFAVDHFLWGTEWLEKKWRGLEAKQVPVDKAIHDYQFMYGLLTSQNLQQTKWGREVAVPYVQFGIQIAERIENIFSSPAH
jgi:hypothetical protein